MGADRLVKFLFLALMKTSTDIHDVISKSTLVILGSHGGPKEDLGHAYTSRPPNKQKDRQPARHTAERPRWNQNPNPISQRFAKAFDGLYSTSVYHRSPLYTWLEMTPRFQSAH